jgi:hypothetical protein
MHFDQTINSIFNKTFHAVNKYKVDFDGDEEEADEDAALLEQTVADPAAAPTDPKAPIVPVEPQAPVVAPTDTKAPADPLAPQDTVGPKTPPAGGGGGAEAEVVKTMADILANANTGNMKLDKMVEALKKEGFDAKLADTGRGASGFNRAEIEVIAKDGTKVAFKDEDGDSQIGMVDKQFREKVQEHAPEHYDKLIQRNNQQQAANKQVGADGTAAVDSKSSADAKGFVGGAQGAGATAPPAAEGAPTKEGAPTAEAAPTDVKAKAADPLAAIGERISSGEQQTNAKGDNYKYQVQDTNLKSCPRGKPACVGCGQCIKSEIFKAQQQGAGAVQEVPADQATIGKAEAPKEQAPAAAVQEAPQAPVVEAPQASLAKVEVPKQSKVKAEETIEDDEALLKAVQAHFDSIGFTEKTAEDLKADGQLAQVASQLGVQAQK